MFGSRLVHSVHGRRSVRQYAPPRDPPPSCRSAAPGEQRGDASGAGRTASTQSCGRFFPLHLESFGIGSKQANRVAEQSLKLLAPQLRKLHALKQLDLYETVMTDAALEALVAEPLAGMWKALKYLRIEGN